MNAAERKLMAPRLLLPGALLALSLYGVALAQNDQEEADPAAGDTSTSAEESAIGQSPEETPDETGADAADPDASADGDTPAGAVTDATMERFRPSEEISSDRSVAFPNDI